MTMTYAEYIKKAIDLTVVEADNGLSYLEPMWRSILGDNGLYFNDVSDADIEPNEVLELLELEVKKRNTIKDNRPAVINWLYETITAQIEPAILQEETDYIKQVTEFMKANHEK